MDIIPNNAMSSGIVNELKKSIYLNFGKYIREHTSAGLLSDASRAGDWWFNLFNWKN